MTDEELTGLLKREYEVGKAAGTLLAGGTQEGPAERWTQGEFREAVTAILDRDIVGQPVLKANIVTNMLDLFRRLS